VGGNRPVEVHVPDAYDKSTSWPLLIFMHGYNSTAAHHQDLFPLSTAANTNGYVYLYPEGIKNTIGERFWRATDACCDFVDSGADDIKYIKSLIH
jgi:polyhydroxybutyrate depolymerase